MLSRLSLLGLAFSFCFAASAPHASAEPSLDTALGQVKQEMAKQREYPKAPPVSFLNEDGESVSLAAFEGKVVLLNFWATWCGPCVAEMPLLDDLQDEYRRKGLEVVAVSLDFGGLKQAKKFFKDRKLRELSPYADPQARLFNAFRGSSLPTTVIIDREGRVRRLEEGYVDWRKTTARDFLEALLTKIN